MELNGLNELALQSLKEDCEERGDSVLETEMRPLVEEYSQRAFERGCAYGIAFNNASRGHPNPQGIKKQCDEVIRRKVDRLFPTDLPEGAPF